MKLRKPPANDVGTPPPFAAAYADVVPESHREAPRDAAITYLDDCFSTIADGEPGQSYADTPIGSYLPSRYEQYYDGHFARRHLVENVHSSSGVRGVGPADRTGKPCS